MTTQLSTSYKEYKKTEIDWLGEIPDHWMIGRVKDELINLDYKRIPVSAELRGQMSDLTYDYYGASGVIDKVDNYIFDEPLILLGEDGANLLMRNSPLAFIARGKYWVNNHAHILKPKKGVLEYFCYLLESYDYTVLISGSAQPKLTTGALNNVHIMIPPIVEQKLIANFLNNKISKIDKKIELLKQKTNHYEKLKQSLINETVTRGLDKSVPIKDCGIEWIGEVPAHWDVKRIADIAKQNKTKNNGMIESNLLSLSYGKIIRKDLNTSFGLLPDSFETYQIVKQDSIILRLTDLQNDQKSLRVGHANEKGIITSAYIGLNFNKSINSKFAYYLLHVFDLCKVFYWFGGGLRSTMRYEDLKVIPFLIPPLNEQKAISDYLDDKTAKIDQIVITINQQIENLKELRKTLINDVVTGKIKVTQDDNKEGLAA